MFAFVQRNRMLVFMMSLILMLAALVPIPAAAQYATKVYLSNGGESLEVTSSGAINVAAGARLNVLGQATITSCTVGTLTTSTVEMTLNGKLTSVDVRASGEVSAAKFAASGAVNLLSTLAVKAAAVFNNDITTTKTIRAADLRATAAITGATIGASGNVNIDGTLKTKGLATLDGGATTTGPLTIGGTYTRASQTHVYTDAKAGATAGWVVRAGANLWASTLPQSQSSSTLVLTINGLHEGDIITKAWPLGQCASAGNNGTVHVELRKLTAAAAANTDASVVSVTTPIMTGNTVINGTSYSTGTIAETVAANTSYYLLITATSGASVTMSLMGAGVTVTQK